MCGSSILSAILFSISSLVGSSFPDSNTISLWLFDETGYPHTTLTDSSEYEYDLCLMDSGHLVSGKFGNALQVSGSSFTSAYAGFRGSVPIDEMREADGVPSGLWGPTVAPEKMLDTLAGGDWTCEFWLKLSAAPGSAVFILDIGHAYEPGAYIVLAGGASSFTVEDAYAGFRAECPTNAGVLTDGQWHHVAFTYGAGSGQFSHYLDGQLQGTPTMSSISVQPTPPVIWPTSLDHDSFGFTASSPLEWRRQNRFNITVGHARPGAMAMNGMVDELRLSNVIRYTADFAVPGSLSRNYGSVPSEPEVPTGPELLFPGGWPASIPVQFGSRKHVFIDDVIVESRSNVSLTLNPPGNRQDLNFTVTSSSWRASVVDIDDKVYMFIPEGYSSSEGICRLKISEDGVNFADPDLGVVEYMGSTHNNFVFYRLPFYGSFFKDLNPNVRAEELYKVTMWSANRGIYLYFSPDGIHWRRNETCMLPLVSGGESETFYDDQRGKYVTFLKRDSSYNNSGCGGGGRRAILFQTGEVKKTWPFVVRPNPYFEGWPMPAVTCEGPVAMYPDAYGQVYRTRAMKYPWAEDTYVAFVWRFAGDESRQVDLGVSRDGINWQFYAYQAWYMESGMAEEVLSLYGLIRRGDELWHYVDYGGAHGGGGEDRVYARLIQRLDGFVSLAAGATAGTVTTLPLIYTGEKLVLNTAATGSVRVGILNQAGEPLPGFDVADCDPIQGDFIERVVTWNGSSNVGEYSGSVVRLRFELQNAKLYAFQFPSVTIAYNPHPADGAIGVTPDVALTWSPGSNAMWHDIYLGINYNVVRDADRSASVYKGRQQLDVNSYDPPAPLDQGTNYYWRIDEVGDSGTSKGNVWNFTTVVAEHVVVEDMESYGPASNRINETWLDRTKNGTGAIIILATEPEPVHGGEKSMAFYYDNWGWGGLFECYSETKRRFYPSPQDWAGFGVKALSLCFYGDPCNDATAAEQMYVGLDDSSGADGYFEVRYGDNGEDMNDIKIAEWQEWNVDLQDFNDGGVNLSDVNSIYIGFGDRVDPVSGGYGLVYFDDIRLYMPRCVPSRAKPAGDLTDDCEVDYADVEVMAAEWLSSGVQADLVVDGNVNFRDYAVLAGSWLDWELWPPE